MHVSDQRHGLIPIRQNAANLKILLGLFCSGKCSMVLANQNPYPNG